MAIRFNSVKFAKEQGKHLMSLPLKDGSSAKVLWNDNSYDCFILKNGKIQEATGEICHPDKWAERFGAFIEKIQKFVKEDVNMDEELVKGFADKNVI